MTNALKQIKSPAKILLRYARYSINKIPVFIVGFQRSGTTMILNVLGRCPKIHAIHEGDGIIMEAKYYRLISENGLRKTIFRTPEPIIIFKPLNDSQYIDRLLKVHPASKAIWVYRDFRDSITSAVKLFGNDYREIISEINKGQFTNPGNEAFGERLSEKNLATIKSFANDPLSHYDAAALIWYLRNWIYFNLNLKDKKNVLICKYEDLVLSANKYFKRIFDFLGADFSPLYVNDVHSHSVNKKDRKSMQPAIETLCEDMLERLNNEYTKQLNAI